LARHEERLWKVAEARGKLRALARKRFERETAEHRGKRAAYRKRSLQERPLSGNPQASPSRTAPWPAGKRSMQNPIAVCTWVFGHNDLSDIASRIASLGLAGAEVLVDLRSCAARDMRRIFEDHGLQHRRMWTSRMFRR
jgi:hypothetical protein